MIDPNAFFCPMVKAFAYGHDDIAISKALIGEGATHLGVALFEEGVRLREAGLSAVEILVFHPMIDQRCVEATVQYGLTPVVSSWRELQLIEASKHRPIHVHLKFNTGMNRLGFELVEIAKLQTYFSSHSPTKLAGVCTHFHSGEDLPKFAGHTVRQLQLFEEVKKSFAGLPTHAFNSSALTANFCLKAKAAFGARPGIALYGIRPEVTHLTSTQKEVYDQLDFKPVMRVVSKIVHTHELKPGETVSYGARFVAEINSTIGVIPIGYADGYPRHLSSRGAMLYDGRPAAVSGTVCMDFTMINLTNLNTPAAGWVGQDIVVLGDSISANDLARLAGTNSYEILTNFSRRVPRVMV